MNRARKHLESLPPSYAMAVTPTTFVARADFESGRGAQYGDLTAWNPDHFSGLCESMNGEFARQCWESGDSDVLLADYVANGTGDAPQGFPHTVAIVNGAVYDFTYRQINPGAAIPVIVSRSEWEKNWTPANGPSTPEDLGFDEDNDEYDGGGFGFYDETEEEFDYDEMDFYHGSRARLEIGDTILPAKEADGEQNWKVTGSDEYAFATTNAEHAFDYAEASFQDGPARVYQVAPIRDVVPDTHDDSDGEYFKSSTGWRVIGIMEAEE